MNEDERKVLTLRFVLFGLGFLGLAIIEGMLMRVRLMNWMTDLFDSEHFYAMLTAHPFVGIYGFAYMTVMGAFYFLVPYVLGRDIFSKRAAYASFYLMVAGVLLLWATTFFSHYAPLYTLYWPLPVAPVAGWDPWSILLFGVASLLIVAGVLTFFFNIFATVFLPSRKAGAKGSKAGFVAKEVLSTGFSLDRFRAGARKVPKAVGKAFRYPVFSVAVFRGCIDTTLNAVVFGGVGALLTLYGASYLIPGAALSPGLVDPLAYKNVFWWGLDLIADGNVLIFTAGTWYLLVPLLLKRPLYGESVVRSVILADLVVSLVVWNHHLLADTPQPISLQVEGQLLTWGELITMGLTMFAVLMTIWKARPVKWTAPMKFVLASILGYMIGGTAGMLQANFALNRYLHNTQWVIGIHAHIQILAGLSLTLFAAIYALFPLLTKKSLDERLANVHLVLFTTGAIVMGLSMGFAGVEGMLRRTLYPLGLGPFEPYMLAAIVGGSLMAIGFGAFLVAMVRAVGIKALLSVFLPQKKAPAAAPPA